MPAVQRGARARSRGCSPAGTATSSRTSARSTPARDADPAAPVREGWMTYPHHPRFGSNYRGLTNRLDLLLECYSYLDVRRARAHDVRDAARDAALRRRAPRRRAAGRRVEPPRRAIGSRSATGSTRSTQPIEIPTRTPRTLDGAPIEVARAALRELRRHDRGRRARRRTSCRPSVAAHLARHGLADEPATGERRRPRSPRSTGSAPRAAARSSRPRRSAICTSSGSATRAPRHAGCAAGARPTSRSARSRSTCASPRATTARSRTP